MLRAVEKDKEAGVCRCLESLAPVLSIGSQGCVLLQGLVSLNEFSVTFADFKWVKKNSSNPAIRELG